MEGVRGPILTPREAAPPRSPARAAPATPGPGSAIAGARVPLAPSLRVRRPLPAPRPPAALAPAEGVCPDGPLTRLPGFPRSPGRSAPGSRAGSASGGRASGSSLGLPAKEASWVGRAGGAVLISAWPTKGAFSKSCSTSLQNNASNIKQKCPSHNPNSVSSLSQPCM